MDKTNLAEAFVGKKFLSSLGSIYSIDKVKKMSVSMYDEGMVMIEIHFGVTRSDGVETVFIYANGEGVVVEEDRLFLDMLAKDGSETIKTGSNPLLLNGHSDATQRAEENGVDKEDVEDEDDEDEDDFDEDKDETTEEDDLPQFEIMEFLRHIQKNLEVEKFREDIEGELIKRGQHPTSVFNLLGGKGLSKIMMTALVHSGLEVYVRQAEKIFTASWMTIREESFSILEHRQSFLIATSTGQFFGPYRLLEEAFESPHFMWVLPSPKLASSVLPINDMLYLADCLCDDEDGSRCAINGVWYQRRQGEFIQDT